MKESFSGISNPKSQGQSLLNQETLSEESAFSKIYLDLASCSLQTVMGYVCLDIVLAISLHYVQAAYPGQPEAANGVGLAYTIVNVAIIPMALGLNQSLNVHVAQALGASKVKLTRNYLNLTFYAHIIYFVPLCIILFFLKKPFSMTIADKPDETSDYAWEYLMPLMGSTIFAVEFECFKTYMIACKVFTPFIFIHIFTTGLHILWCYLFIELMDLKITGACYAILITEVLNCVLLAIYMLVSSEKQHLSGFTFKFILIKKFKLFRSYMKSSFSIVIHVYADFFVFFLLTFLAMGLTSEKLSAQIAFSNTSAVYFRMPISLSLALLTYIGSEMGMLRVKNAQRYALAGFILFFGFAASIILALWLLRNVWAEFYGPDNEKIQDELLGTLPYFLLGCVILDGAQGSLTGVLKGIEKAPIVTYSTLVAYYVIGIPVICGLTFDWGAGWSVTGIWLGFGLANAVLLALYIYLILKTNWSVQAHKIKHRVNVQNHMNASSVQQIYEEPKQGRLTNGKL